MATPVTIEDTDELGKLLKLKQVELKELCALKGLAISGYKTELANRLIAWKPAGGKPSALQLKQLHELEINRKFSFGPKSYVDEAQCRKANSELSKMCKS